MTKHSSGVGILAWDGPITDQLCNIQQLPPSLLKNAWKWFFTAEKDKNSVLLWGLTVGCMTCMTTFHRTFKSVHAPYSRESDYVCCSANTVESSSQSLFSSFWQFWLKCIPPNHSHFRKSSSFIRQVHKIFPRRFLPAFLLCLNLSPYQRHIGVKHIISFLGNFKSFSLKKSWRHIPCNSRTGRFYPLKMGCKWRQPSTTSPHSPHIHTFPAWFLECRQRISLGI